MTKKKRGGKIIIFLSPNVFVQIPRVARTVPVCYRQLFYLKILSHRSKNDTLVRPFQIFFASFPINGGKPARIVFTVVSVAIPLKNNRRHPTIRTEYFVQPISRLRMILQNVSVAFSAVQMRTRDFQRSYH